MPALPNVPSVIKSVIRGTSGEATELPWANILHWAFSGTTPTTAILTAVANQIISNWSSHMAPEQVNNLTMTGVECIDLTSPTSASVSVPASVAGTRGDDEIPANVAYLVDYPIVRRYRGGHPRTYLIVLGNADFLDAAHWSSAATSEVATHFEAFLNAVVGFSSGGTTINNLVNVSYIDKALNPTPPHYRTTPIVDVITVADAIGNQQMASQRRRIGRHRK